MTVTSQIPTPVSHIGKHIGRCAICFGTVSATAPLDEKGRQIADYGDAKCDRCGALALDGLPLIAMQGQRP